MSTDTIKQKYRHEALRRGCTYIAEMGVEETWLHSRYAAASLSAAFQTDPEKVLHQVEMIRKGHIALARLGAEREARRGVKA